MDVPTTSPGFTGLLEEARASEAQRAAITAYHFGTTKETLDELGDRLQNHQVDGSEWPGGGLRVTILSKFGGAVTASLSNPAIRDRLIPLDDGVIVQTTDPLDQTLLREGSIVAPALQGSEPSA
jgi:hypothetical protein